VLDDVDASDADGAGGGDARVVATEMVVVLPAPLGPRQAVDQSRRDVEVYCRRPPSRDSCR